MNKARITYRFTSHKSQEDNKDQGKIVPLFHEEYDIIKDKTENEAEIIDTHALNQFTSDFGAWSSPFDAETDRLEKLIRETDKRPRETSNADESRRSFDAVTGYYEERDATKSSFGRGPWVDEGLLDHPPRYARHSGAPWFRIITSVTGAVGTGLLFGYFVLSMFTGEQDSIKAGLNDLLNPNQISSSADPTPSPQENTEDAAQDAATTAAPGTVRVDLPAQTYYMLQNGVFSSSEGAEAAQVELKTQGLAASGESADKYYVYAGITTNRDDALLLSHQLKDKNLEVFIKAYELPAVASIRWNGDKADKVAAYFAGGSRLVQMVDDLALIHLQESQPSPLDTTTAQSLKKEHQAWTEAVSGISGGFSDDDKQVFQKMNNAIHTAVVSMEEYDKNLSPAHLWQAQTALMQYILSENDLLDRIAAK